MRRVKETTNKTPQMIELKNLQVIKKGTRPREK
jgi:hypothetical protein